VLRDSKTVAKVSEAEIRMALEDTSEWVLDPDIAAVWRDYDEGKRQGEIDGEIMGQRKMLKRLLDQRFGVLPADAIRHVFGVSVYNLDGMIQRVLTAPTLDEVMGWPIDPAS
jgi:hypothetical protein